MAKPTRDQAVAELQALAQNKPVVTFKAAINSEVDMYAEAGMRARLVHFGWNDKFDSHLATFDFSEFEEHNLPLESPFMGDKTARQVGHYKPVDLYYFPPESWAERFSVDDPRLQALLTAYKEQAAEGQPYVGWLETVAYEALGIKLDQAETSASPAP